MPRRFNPFAMFTEEHDIIARLELTPCAALLYRDLLRAKPAGRPQEFELKKEFCIKWNYSLKWAKQGLQKLIDLDLVEVLRTFSGQGYRLIAWHPSQKTSPTVLETSIDDHKTSQKQPSNADSVAVSYRESRETTDIPTHHPVSTDERERVIGTSQISKTPEIDPKAKEQIEAAGFQLNSTLGSIVRSKSAEIILSAVEAAKQYKDKLQAQNRPLSRKPEAILAAAIQAEWKPTGTENGANAMPPEFDEWFRLAQGEQVASASSIQTNMTNQPNGVLCVLTRFGWEPFDQVRAAYSIKRLQEMKTDREKFLRSAQPNPEFRTNSVDATLAAATTAAN
jgi:hypothetical protein